MTIQVALDGHDGAGKTSIAHALASELNGDYVRTYGAPYGTQLIACYDQQDYKGVLETSDRACHAARSKVIQGKNNHAVYDRFWLTAYTLLPSSFQHSEHQAMPTVVCWADLETTLARLVERDEEKFDVDYHQSYIQIYADLAKQYDCLLLNTSQMGIDESVKVIVDWMQKVSPIV